MAALAEDRSFVALDLSDGTGSEVRIRPIEKLSFESFTAERQLTNSLQPETAQRWNGSTGRGAVIAESDLDRPELADSSRWGGSNDQDSSCCAPLQRCATTSAAGSARAMAAD
jgi:hypothetical protein